MLTFTLLPCVGWTAGAWHAAGATQQWLNPPGQRTSLPVTGHGEDGSSSVPYQLNEAPDADDVARDLYGNDVSTAVATYKRDHTGSVYEEHSPKTQVARLKPPTT